MNDNFAIQLFEGKKVRIAWDAEQEKYYFSVTDIVQVLTDSVNPRDYIKKMLRRDPELKSKWGTICPPVEMLAPDGKRRKTSYCDFLRFFAKIIAKMAFFFTPKEISLRIRESICGVTFFAGHQRHSCTDKFWREHRCGLQNHPGTTHFGFY